MPKGKTWTGTLIAGGCAGAADALICHPLDTIKTRLQLQKSIGRGKGIVGTATSIVRVEGPLALYKGTPFVKFVGQCTVLYCIFLDNV